MHSSCPKEDFGFLLKKDLKMITPVSQNTWENFIYSGNDFS